jgi:hypothetical protein
MNCDLQRLLVKSDLFRHLVALIAFFFLFTVLDSGNKSHVGIIWLKTILVYILFLMIIKSKWYFTFPVLGILLVDQSIKAHINYLERNDKIDEINKYKEIRKILNIIIIIIIIGFLNYAYIKYHKYNSDFSIGTLLFATKCK